MKLVIALLISFSFGVGLMNIADQALQRQSITNQEGH